jgi:CheY-like chemotaxis protein
MQRIVIDPLPVVTVGSVPRILIVDDEDSVACVFKRILKQFSNYEAVTATQGENALQLFRQQHFDLLITDYQMPQLDGIALAEKIRQLSSQIPIIIITAFDDEKLHQQATKLSINIILRKPVEITELHQAASEALQKTSS